MEEYQTTHLEDGIEKLLKGIGIYTPKHLDLFIIAQRLGIDLNVGDRLNCYEGARIYLNIHHTKAELWYEFSHELGHVVRHAGNQLFLPEGFIKMQEAQAANFALLFSVPTFMLRQIELPHDIQEAVRIIAKTFNVTIEIAVKRLKYHENKLLSAQYIRSLQENCTVNDEINHLWYK